MPKVPWKGRVFFKWFNEYLKEHGIQRKYSCSYSPHQNGVVERKKRHIIEITHAMLNEKNLLNSFSVEVVATIIYILNWTLIAIVHGMTPEKKIHKQKTRSLTPIMFGCITYMHVLDEKKLKLDPKVEKCIFIKHFLEQKEYKCFNPSTQKL